MQMLGTGVQPMSEQRDLTEWNREQLRKHDESQFERRFARLARNPVHNFVAAEWFAAAATECREMFRDGHFYGCISVAGDDSRPYLTYR